jgi:hypothetical protein
MYKFGIERLPLLVLYGFEGLGSNGRFSMGIT